MADARSDEHSGYSLVLRLMDRSPIEPALLSLVVALLACAGLLAAEVASGRFQELSVVDGDGLRNLRLAFGFIAMLAYIPTASFYVLRGARRTVDELRPLLRLEDADVRARADAIGEQPVKAVRRAGWVGVAIALTIPLIVDLPYGENPYALTQPLETIWHRIATPILGWWCGRLGYLIVLESRRLSDLARGLRSIDLFELKPLLPFARQGLSHALSMVGFVAIFAVMSSFEVGLGLAAVLVTLVNLPAAIFGMVLPLQGVHSQIREEKERRLAWCRKRIRVLGFDSSRDLDSAETRDLADLLVLRSHLEAVREWPFDISVAVRLAVYLVIPLVSWAGAALVERMVDSLLG
jgi:hypothetical protein